MLKRKVNMLAAKLRKDSGRYTKSAIKDIKKFHPSIPLPTVKRLLLHAAKHPSAVLKIISIFESTQFGPPRYPYSSLKLFFCSFFPVCFVIVLLYHYPCQVPVLQPLFVNIGSS